MKEFIRHFDWITALLVCVLLGLSYQLDEAFEIEDRSAEWRQAAAIEARHKQQIQEQRRQRAALALCREQLGAESEPTWTQEGQLSCQPKRGSAITINSAAINSGAIKP